MVCIVSLASLLKEYFNYKYGNYPVQKLTRSDQRSDIFVIPSK